MEAKRVFLAINLPPEVKQELHRLLCLLRQNNPSPAFHWVREEGIHLTLHFFGNLETDRINRLTPLLKDFFANYKGFTLALDRFGCFPNEKNPRVFFIALQPNAALLGMANNLRKYLAGLSFEVESRPFQAHLTLARLDNYGSRTSIVENRALWKFDFHSFPVESVELMESKLQRGGAVYSVVEKFRLEQT
jgi:2'-5' RNA ligase